MQSTGQAPAGEQTFPTPVARDSRTCFGILWFATEEEADRAAAMSSGRYNGGFMHGTATGRDSTWDREVDGQRQYAVTTS